MIWCHRNQTWQETKLEHPPPSSHYQCGNYFKSLRRNPDQLPCGRVDLYKEGTLPPSGPDGLSPSCRSSSYPGGYSCNNTLCLHSKQQTLTSRDLTRNIRGQILITGDFNGHSYLWGSHDVDTRGEVIERFTNKPNLYILNDGNHTYLKPQAQHVNKPTSAIDVTISTLGLALRSVWEVLPDTHGSDHYPILTSILQSVAEIAYNQAVILPTGFLPRPIGNSFMMCVWKTSLRIY